MAKVRWTQRFKADCNPSLLSVAYPLCDVNSCCAPQEALWPLTLFQPCERLENGVANSVVIE